LDIGAMRNIVLLLALIVLVSCNTSREFIIPYDYITNFPDTKNGLTQDQVNEYFQSARNQMQLNTVGKKLPEIFIYDINNKKVKLNKLINKTTLIYATDNHCGFGLDVLDNDLPYALEKLKEDSVYLSTITLLVRRQIDSGDSEALLRKAAEVKLKYDHLYIIDESESEKINEMNATILIVDRNQYVIFLSYGAFSDPNKLYEHLKSNLLLMSSHRPDN
jgi:hypothetical protein